MEEAARAQPYIVLFIFFGGALQFALYNLQAVISFTRDVETKAGHVIADGPLFFHTGHYNFATS